MVASVVVEPTRNVATCAYMVQTFAPFRRQLHPSGLRRRQNFSSHPPVRGVEECNGGRERSKGGEEEEEEGRKEKRRVVRTLSPDSSGQGQWRRVTSYGAAVTQSVARATRRPTVARQPCCCSSTSPGLYPLP
ncbi:hypothetical protein K0M31_006466 [Melipona bicolor]|uniref:Uncharacterized protein n=1 Tax=Melipona bicolor TaxID=60889 RepID=A0AA40KLU6_9HYME|nr:hypothetical protein K0M31_006466 [Melipona bicolor]